MMISISSLTVTSLPIISSAFWVQISSHLRQPIQSFVAVDEMLHFAVFFRPIMNPAGQTLTQSPQLMHLSCENIT